VNRFELAGGRTLASTNDFTGPSDSIAATMFNFSDPHGYVDRSDARFSVTRRFGGSRTIARAEFGYGDDRYRRASWTHHFRSALEFRENHHLDEGSYFRTAGSIQLNRNANGESLIPGIGMSMFAEIARGTLSWQRAELKFVARRERGPFMATTLFDAGVVGGMRIPPQQLFELGAQQHLPGYDEKEFAGSQAAVLRSQLMYSSPWLRKPVRLLQFIVPGVAPGASVGLQSGWADAPSLAARESIQRLRLPTDMLADQHELPHTTDGIRTTVSAGLRLFSGAGFIGAARAVDHRAPWKLAISLGQQW
jgi:hypothetical protein